MTSERPSEGEYFIWRIMIDKAHQGSGYGEAALRLLVERIQAIGDPKVLLLSHMQGNERAARFFQAFGFEYTGEALGEADLVMAMHFD